MEYMEKRRIRELSDIVDASGKTTFKVTTDGADWWAVVRKVDGHESPRYTWRIERNDPEYWQDVRLNSHAVTSTAAIKAALEMIGTIETQLAMEVV